MGQYKDGLGDDRQFYLSAWSGRMDSVDRKNGTEIPASKVFLSVLGGIQPDMLGKLAGVPQGDGFFERLLFAYPMTPPLDDMTDTPLTDHQVSTWKQVVDRLIDLPDDEGKPRILTWAGDGDDRWHEWVDHHRWEMRQQHFPSGLTGSWRKMEAHIARFAIILHMLNRVTETNYSPGDDEGGVDENDVDRAELLVDYFKDHLRRVHGHVNQTEHDVHVERIVTYLRDRGQRRERSTQILRDLFQGKNAAFMRETFRRAADLGIGEEVQEPGVRRRKVGFFRLFNDEERQELVSPAGFAHRGASQ
jgi:hypothetical protein